MAGPSFMSPEEVAMHITVAAVNRLNPAAAPGAASRSNGYQAYADAVGDLYARVYKQVVAAIEAAGPQARK